MKTIKQKILSVLAGIVIIALSLLMIPHCDGDGTYLGVAIPMGLLMIFGPICLDKDEN